MPTIAGRPIAIAPITTPELAPPDMVAVAARTGYSHVGLRMLPSTPGGFSWPLMTDAMLLRQTQARMQDTGVGVLDIDIIRLRPDTNPATYRQFFETGQALGARAVLVAADDPDPQRLAVNFATLCDLAAPCKLTVDIEFMPWTGIPSLEAASQLIRTVARPNAGILVDALHLDRSATRIEDIHALPQRWLHYMQICDAPAEAPYSIEDMIHCARYDRMFPGEGGLDLVAMLRALPGDIPISVEVPTETLARTVGAEARAARAMEATRAVLSRIV
jgi:sugar phosphate isomerase/epimerase